VSPAAAIRVSGFQVLLGTDGEPLTYKSWSIKALVDRNIDVNELGKLAIDFEPFGMTRIEFLKSQLATRPEAGETFVDGIGYTHRVRYVLGTDITWKCYCQQYETT
jgi:hypothetical protein